MKSKTIRHLSPFRLALREFSRNRWAVVCAGILGLFYFLSLSADFWAPYSASMEDRNFSYGPPTVIRLRDEQGRWQRPFVYGRKAGFDRFHQRVYARQSDRKYPLRFFVKGQEYSWLGLKMDRHLFGVEEPGRIYLLGADIRGRDIFSRILHGGKISLLIGLVAVSISFSLGLLIGGIAGYYGGWGG